MQHGTVDVDDAAFAIGQRMVANLTDEIGTAKTTALLVSLAQKGHGSQPRHSSDHSSDLTHLVEEDDYEDFEYRVPDGFWIRFFKGGLKLLSLNPKKNGFLLDLENDAKREHSACETRLAVRCFCRGMLRCSICAAENNKKAAYLGWALLQFFVDIVRKKPYRADSVMLNEKTRGLCEELLCDESRHSSLRSLVGAERAMASSAGEKKRKSDKDDVKDPLDQIQTTCDSSSL